MSEFEPSLAAPCTSAEPVAWACKWTDHDDRMRVELTDEKPADLTGYDEVRPLYTAATLAAEVERARQEERARNAEALSVLQDLRGDLEDGDYPSDRPEMWARLSALLERRA